MFDLSKIDWTDAAVAAWKLADGWVIVRPTTDGRFAVIRLSGPARRVLKVIADQFGARAYCAAVARNS